jgi:class 3 adenylate cyclase/alpha-beta hydrolase superfamily lysophospholipase
MEPRIQYVKTSDGVNIAYAVFGEGPPIVYIAASPFGVHLYSQFALAREGTERLVASGWQVIRYDARGTGSSDRETAGFSLEARLRDLEAVADRVATERFALYGHVSGALPALAYAARQAGRVSALVLTMPFASGAGFNATQERRVLKAMWPLMEEHWELMTLNIAHLTFRFTDSEVASQLAAASRSGISAATYRALEEATDEIDLTDLLGSIGAPALVIQDANYRGSNDELLPLVKKVAASIPNARLVATADPMQAMDEFLRECGLAPKVTSYPPAPAGGFQTILFTDIEGSTALTERLGDAKAREILREHERTVREALAVHGGSEIKTMGDGFMASFGSATKALECAVAIQKAFDERNRGVGAQQPRHESGKRELSSVAAPLRPDVEPRSDTHAPLRVRIGLNAGEPVAEEGPDGRADLFGTAVNLAARIAGHAQGGEILVSNVVRELAAGKGFAFADRGEAALKGFEEPVRLYELTWRQDP